MKLPRHAELWAPGLIASTLRRRTAGRRRGPVHVLFCIADHYEPNNGSVDLATERARVRRWVEQYPRVADRFRDADGRPPQHSFFFPAEVYRREHLDALAELCAGGYGEVEVHLHHAHDTAQNLRDTLCRFRDALVERHGLLCRDADGRVRYGFLHGNWALDNGRNDGGASCGVNCEMSVLLETGCYADFTMPAAPDPAQSRIVNSIYYSVDDPERSRSYDRGVPVRVGGRPPAAALLMVQGPLSVYTGGRWGVMPRLDNSSLDSSPGHRPTLARFERWVNAGVSVAGRPEWVVVKIHSHGAKERNADVLLGDHMVRFHEAVNAACSGGRYVLHYVTAREIANIVHAAEQGLDGNPGNYRDFTLRPLRSREPAAGRTEAVSGGGQPVDGRIDQAPATGTFAHV